MAATADAIFSTVASDIKSYSGNDPLLPWLRGVKKLRESLPPTLLKAKLPRLLQKCAQKFESDKRYKNDPRYLRVWLQLKMDYVDEPRLLLRTMEKNQIGMKRSLFYQAYALCYEKMKKYEEAEKMYHLGVQNLAEPVNELQRSYEQFLHRMQRHKTKKSQNTLRADKRPMSAAVRTDENNENVCTTKAEGKQIPDGRSGNVKKPLEESNRHGSNGNSSRNGGFEVYVDSNEAVGGTKLLSKPEKKEPLHILIDDEEQQVAECCEEEDEEEEDSPFVFTCPQDLSASEDGCSRSPRNKLMREDTVVRRFVGSTILNEPEVENVCHHGLVDPTVNLKEAMEDINNMFGKPIDFVRARRTRQPAQQPHEEEEEQQLGGGGFFILPDDDESDGRQNQPMKKQEEQLGGGFFILPDDDDVADHKQNHKGKKRQEEVGGFSILPDDADANHPQQSKKPASSDTRGSDLFEPTVCTKQAMDDINKLFGMPLDF
ncbi:unnamed protein product [Linum tenue]|uniref:BUB1 N-terminal domain-containing protein n=1 Tax=Linum tenue TaxID=586396 RepID=A0AAV0GZ58_9ROSI|nr:unnamed protein product [Linum tenue]